METIPSSWSNCTARWSTCMCVIHNDCNTTTTTNAHSQKVAYYRLSENSPENPIYVNNNWRKPKEKRAPKYSQSLSVALFLSFYCLFCFIFRSIWRIPSFIFGRFAGNAYLLICAKSKRPTIYTVTHTYMHKHIGLSTIARKSASLEIRRTLFILGTISSAIYDMWWYEIVWWEGEPTVDTYQKIGLIERMDLHWMHTLKQIQCDMQDSVPWFWRFLETPKQSVLYSKSKSIAPID